MWLYPLVNFIVFISFLVGRGAHDWAVSHGIPPCPSEKMATSEYRCAVSERNAFFVAENLFKELWSYADAVERNILSHAEFSLSAYKRNKRKMELAEKMDTGHNQTKKRRQSSENVSTALFVGMLTFTASSRFFLSSSTTVTTDPTFPAGFIKLGWHLVIKPEAAPCWLN